MKILVLAPTGTQGMPTVRELIGNGYEVTGFCLPNDPKAGALEELGAGVVYGNLLEEADLEEAMKGKDGVVFIPAIPTAGNPINEITVGLNVVNAAEKAGIQYLVHTSVNRAGEHEEFERWGKDFWESYRMYWLGKSFVIDLVKVCKIPHWTILKPAYMMDCFIPPKSIGMYPQLSKGIIKTPRFPETKLTMMCGDDMGKFIAKVFSDFSAFDNKEISLAGDSLDMDSVAAIISKVTGKSVQAISSTREEMTADRELEDMMKNLYKDFVGMDVTTVLTGTIDAFEWDNYNGYNVDIEEANSYGVKLSTFEEWANRHKDEFYIQ